MNRNVIIMAGGSGSRLWPLSREKKPKQFISVDGSRSMLEQTLTRALKVTPRENCYIITNHSLLELTRATVADMLPEANILTEPERKNTSACIAYSAMYLKQKLGSGLVSFIPADGYVKDQEAYRVTLENAFSAAEIMKTLIVVGITPLYPSTAYGYIHTDKNPRAQKPVMKVLKFYEKPDIKTAGVYVESGEYLWNSGMVFADMDILIDHIKDFLPNHYDRFNAALRHLGEDRYEDYLQEAYRGVESISFDYAVLEKAQNIHTVQGSFDWDDIGSLDSLSKTLEPDETNNVVQGKHFGLSTTNSIIYSEDGFIATIDIHNTIVIAASNAILVCPKEKAQDVKMLVEKLKENKLQDFVN